MSIPILQIPIRSSTVIPYLFVGDTIDEIVVVSADFPDLTTSSIKMQVYNKSNVKVLDVDEAAGITVNSATSFTIDEIAAASNPFTEGTFTGDLEITDAAGTKKTYFRVVYNVQKQYTV